MIAVWKLQKNLETFRIISTQIKKQLKFLPHLLFHSDKYVEHLRKIIYCKKRMFSSMVEEKTHCEYLAHGTSYEA